jgi:hypothetical protein
VTGRAALLAGVILAAAAPAGAEPAAALAPLASPSPYVEMAVPGHQPAVVSLPLGSTGPRPVLIITHGNYDRPEWECEIWRTIVGNRAFVLCPRGELRPGTEKLEHPRYRYRNNQALEKEVDAALTALQARFAGRVQGAPYVYAGFSQGSIMGPPILSRRGKDFPRAVLLEGGSTQWDGRRARAFAAAAGAGARVLFVCGLPGCAATSRRAGKLLERHGVKTRVLYGKNVGHFYADKVSEQVTGSLDWLIEGDPRW